MRESRRCLDFKARGCRETARYRLLLGVGGGGNDGWGEQLHVQPGLWLGAKRSTSDCWGYLVLWPSDQAAAGPVCSTPLNELIPQYSACK